MADPTYEAARTARLELVNLVALAHPAYSAESIRTPPIGISTNSCA